MRFGAQSISAKSKGKGQSGCVHVALAIEAGVNYFNTRHEEIGMVGEGGCQLMRSVC